MLVNLLIKKLAINLVIECESVDDTSKLKISCEVVIDNETIFWSRKFPDKEIAIQDTSSTKLWKPSSLNEEICR